MKNSNWIYTGLGITSCLFILMKVLPYWLVGDFFPNPFMGTDLYIKCTVAFVDTVLLIMMVTLFLVTIGRIFATMGRIFVDVINRINKLN